MPRSPWPERERECRSNQDSGDLSRTVDAMHARTVTVFADENRIHAADFFSVYRDGDVAAVRIEGELTDARNPVWRGFVDARFDKDGWPRVMALDVRGAIPMASLPMRIQTALWGKRVLGKVAHGVIALGRDARVGITVRAILRVAGMNNVTLVDELAALDAEVARVSAALDLHRPD